MKRSIFYIVILAVLFAMMIVSTSRADGLRDPAFNTYLPDQNQNTTAPPVQTASYGGDLYGYGYGYAGYAYDPYGPPLYSPWSSCRCRDCSGVWDNYGCHEFKQGGHGRCGGKCGKHGGCQGGTDCADDSCTASADHDATAPTEPEPVEPTSPPDPPMPTEEKSAASGTTWPQASGLFPVANH